MRVWIDLANSPHPLLFEPIARRLSERGAEVAFTVRDHAQTRELALDRWPEAEVVGRASPGGLLAKPWTLAGRVAELARWGRNRRPDVALSHNSYAQILAARRLGIRVVTGMDYEHQPANHLAFRAADRILLPEAMPAGKSRRQGARGDKVIRYPGLKEEVYLAELDPDPGVRASVTGELGDAHARARLAVARAAPAGAAYHRRENPLFERALRALEDRGDHLTVVLARHPEQREAIRALGLEHAVVPERAVDARSLLWAADLFLGAGGTMTREAALLGTPAWSIFAARPAAVDRLLERRGLIRRLEDPVALGGEAPRSEPDPEALARLRRSGARIAERFVAAVLGDDPAGRAADNAPRRR